MVIVLFVVAAALTGVPIIVVVLVSVASRREDYAWTLAGLAPGTVQAAARRVLGLQSRGIGWLQHAGTGATRTIPRSADQQRISGVRTRDLPRMRALLPPLSMCGVVLAKDSLTASQSEHASGCLRAGQLL